MPIFEPVFAALINAGVRHVVVGGVATVLHGHARLTADLDLSLDLDSDEVGLAIEALTAIGLKPLLPVPPADFADPEIRRRWVEERNLKVFSLYDPAEPMRHVDLFAENPIPFAELWGRSEEVALGQLRVRIASIADLIAMKRVAGRPQDLADVEALEIIRDRQTAGDDV